MDASWKQRIMGRKQIKFNKSRYLTPKKKMSLPKTRSKEGTYWNHTRHITAQENTNKLKTTGFQIQ